jgi:hypothetical protein
VASGAGPTRARPENKRITLHFTPTTCSWLNMVEIFFGIIARSGDHQRAGLLTVSEQFLLAIDRASLPDQAGPRLIVRGADGRCLRPTDRLVAVPEIRAGIN